MSQTARHPLIETLERWWAVRVLYEHLVNEVPAGMFEDVILLVLAQSGGEEGNGVRREGQPPYENAFGEVVVVRFDQVTDVHETSQASIEDGTHVYTSLEAGSDADRLKERGRTRRST